jgi:Fe(3+) dicitrate transport protein
MKQLYVLFFLCISANSLAQIKEKIQSIDSLQKLDEVFIKSTKIFGNKYVAGYRTGSAYYISNEELQKFSNIDINRVLTQVPGVNYYEEDGFGLRPNISLRGTSPQRSAKITLMEDGVLIAPAPYSAPAAYYFPSVARMQAVEILKGSSQVQYGPFTTGGAINFVSSEIPSSLSGVFSTSYGSFQSSKVYTKIGNQKERLGYLIEYLNMNSNGFKQLGDNENTGFDINEIVTKLSYSSKATVKLPQSVEFKFQYYDEFSNETYVGLTKDDFNTTPYLRYAGSQIDNMKATHFQYMLTHNINLGEHINISTNGYFNEFKRNWYKLDDVIYNNVKVGIASVINNYPMYLEHYNIVKGNLNSAIDALLVKANNRIYTSKGIQTTFDMHWFGKNNTFHDLEIGVRFHYDDEDRFQWEDGYSITNGNMLQTSNGIKGDQGNKITSANALASYITYKFKKNNVTITPGVRYENIRLQSRDFGSGNSDRNSTRLSTVENKVNVVIPGIGFNIQFSKQFSAFGGVHKGFSPPGTSEGEKPELSTNYELGSRFNYKGIRGEFTGFMNDYSNLLGNDLAATGGTGTLDQFNAGEVLVSGVEFLLNIDLLPSTSKIKFPVTFSYTYTNAVFSNNFESDESIWGEIREGDAVPYIAPHQFNITTSLQFKQLELNTSIRYNGAFNTQTSAGGKANVNKLPSNLIVDLSGKYILNNTLKLTTQVINLFDRAYAASRVPAGWRPGHPFGIFGGIEVAF